MGLPFSLFLSHPDGLGAALYLAVAERRKSTTHSKRCDTGTDGHPRIPPSSLLRALVRLVPRAAPAPVVTGQTSDAQVGNFGADGNHSKGLQNFTWASALRKKRCPVEVEMNAPSFRVRVRTCTNLPALCTNSCRLVQPHTSFSVRSVALAASEL